MTSKRMTRSTSGAFACLWLIAAVNVMMRAVSQSTFLNGAPLAAPALRSNMVGRRGEAAATQASTTMLAAKDKNDDDKKEDDDAGGDDKAAFSLTATVMQVPFMGLLAVGVASSIAKVVGAVAEPFETGPPSKDKK